MLLAAARHEARMAAPVGNDGKFTVRDHVAAAVRAKRMPPEALHGPGVPAPVAYLWDWYWQIAEGRTHNGMTGQPEPIRYVDIDAWSRLTGRQLLPQEVETLVAIDRAVRNPGPAETKAHG